MKKHLIFFLFLWLSGASCVKAESDEKLDHFPSLSLEELMAVEVTISTKTKQSIKKAPAVVTVVTDEDIKATGATNLVDILETVPGVYVRYSTFANRPLVHFRGANATQTLLMVNGARIKDLMWGFGIYWKGLPASIIERVEIIRGPGSALFGADASAGVINVITKTASEIEVAEYGMRAGSYLTKNGWMQHGWNWNSFDINMTADVYTTEGHAPLIASDGQTAQDDDFGTRVSFAPDTAKYGWRNEDLRISIGRDHWRLLGDYTRQRELEIGLTGAGVLDPVTRGASKRANVSLLYDNANVSNNWSLRAELRYSELDYSSGEGFQEWPPGFTDATGTYPDGVLNQMRSAERSWQFETSALFRCFDDHSLQVGVGHIWQDLYYVEQWVNSGTGPDGIPLPSGGPMVDVSDTQHAFAPERSNEIDYLFLQDTWTLSDDWELTAGARYDQYTDFGGTFNPRLVLVWQATDRVTAKLLYGQAFRAPSFQELYAETAFAQPNPDLEPERSATEELALSYMASTDLHFGLSMYRFKQSDLIRAVGEPRVFQNTGDHTIRGVELEVQWQTTGGLRVAGNYTYRNQDDTENRAYDEPDRDGYLRVDWTFLPHWNWNIQSNWTGERQRPSGDTRPPVSAYLMTDTTFRYCSFDRWEFAASIRNLLNVDAREYTGQSVPDDLPLPGRNYYAEMRYRF